MSRLIFDTSRTLNSEDLADIVANASFLWERLSAERFVIDRDRTNTFENTLEVEQRCERWCQTVSHENDPAILQKRLQWEGLALDTIRPRLGKVKLAAGQPLPPWAETLRQIIQVAAEFNLDTEVHLPTIPEVPIPFEDILLPAIKVAREHLLTRLGYLQFSLEFPPLSIFSKKAYFSLERSLLEQLSGLCSKTFELEFSRVRSFGQNLITLLGLEETASHSKTNYKQFVQEVLQDGLLDFFQTYPVLGRLIATSVDFWVSATVEFIQRLAQDQEIIQQTFGSTTVDQPQNIDEDLTGKSFHHRNLIPTSSSVKVAALEDQNHHKVVEVESFLSDPHNQGRTVILLTFQSGLKLVYKPKDLGLEVAWNQFLDWCNQHSQLLDLRVMKVAHRENYGWVEYVEQRPCIDTTAAKRCYQRAGMLLCLIYVLRGTDCHCENLIASGEHFVLIDMETLLHHDAHLIENSPAAQVMAPDSVQQFWDSVLRTGLLPRWDFSADNRIAYDISGLSNAQTQQATQRTVGWQLINTDAMYRSYEAVKSLPTKTNVLFLGDTALSPHDYQADIANGFEQMYRFLMVYQAQLLAPDGPLAALQHQQVRFIFRSTQIYSTVLRNVLAPTHLKNGVDYSIELDQLSRAFVVSQDKPNAWPILWAELRAMEQLDIPFFTAHTNQSSLLCQGTQVIPQYFKQASYQQVLNQIQSLSEADLARQVAILQGSFYARVAQTTAADQPTPGQKQGLPLLDKEQLIQAAQEIATDLDARAIHDADGSLNWVGMGFVSKSERFQLQMLKDGLYDGRCGVALFLAGLGQVTQDAYFSDLALRVLHPLRQQLKVMPPESQQRFARLTGIGGADGLGSILYGLVKVSQLLDDETCLDDAHRLADWMTPDVIAADQQLDIIGGAAGAILGLLSLYAATGKAAVLETAIASGQHLMDQRVSDGDRPKAWKTLAEKPMTGFSHGAAGIAYALLRLYAVTQNADYRAAALEGIAYERSVFCPDQANWPDRRFATGREPVFAVQWCCGSTGIGLARLGHLEIVDSPDIRSDIELALHTTQKHGVRTIDHLCCGNMGRIETLYVGAQRFSRSDWHQAALLQATQVVARARQTGGYRLFANLPNSVFNPGFFQGVAGIGYQLLRLACPALPSVLLWE